MSVVAHDHESLRQTQNLIKHLALYRVWFAENCVKHGYNRHVQLAKQLEHIAARWAAKDAKLMLEYDQIHTIGACQVQSFSEGQNSELFAIQPDNSHFAGTNFPINPDEWTGRRRTWRIRATQDTPAGLDLFMHSVMDIL